MDAGTILSSGDDQGNLSSFQMPSYSPGFSRANRELAFLSVTFAHGVELGHVTDNPVKGVRKLELKARKRCPTDAEHDAVYKQAPEWLQIGMEVAYLYRLRWSEVFGTDLMAKHDDSAPGLLRQHIEDKD